MTEAASDDPFIRKFFTRIPPTTAASFTEEQLVAIKMAFGGRAWGAHAVDIRRSLPLIGGCFYLVWLMGWEHRTPDRVAEFHQSYPLLKVANVIAVILPFAVLALAFAGGLYALEATLGIDLFAAD
jgi:hypothetical protein